MALSWPRMTIGKLIKPTAILATNIPPANQNEAAIVATLGPGAYTAIESGKAGGTGVGLVEVYNLQ